MAPLEVVAEPREGGAREVFRRGLAALRQRRFDDAVRDLTEASRLSTQPVIFVNLGLACRELGRYREAIAAFERYAVAPEPETSPGQRVALREEIARLRAQLGRVTLVVRPVAATLQVDGHVLEATETIVLDPGTHVLDLSAPGYEPERRQLTLQPGGQAALDVELRPSRVEEMGRLIVEPSVAAATVMIDGTVVGTGRTEREVHAGEHTVGVRAAGYRPFQRTVQVSATGAVRFDATLVPVHRSNGWLLPVAISAGSAVVLGLAITGIAILLRGTAEVAPGRWATLTEGQTP
jgi:hypothetical protein